MAVFQAKTFETVSASGFSRAKKLADLAIKTNTDDAGGVTARGYEQAISILQPFINSGKESEALDAQRLIAGYNNSLDKMSAKERDQNETVASFKLQEQDAYFTSFDGDFGGFRNPGNLVSATSEVLDNLLLGVINAIDEKEAKGDSTDALYSYLNDLQKRADTMRDLANRFESGELTGATLDGFGYYVDTNPLDGSIRAAAIIPAGMAPEGLAQGFRRLDATADLGGGLLPVYAPATRDAYGGYTARIGQATWSGTGDGALTAGEGGADTNLFQQGGFNINDNMRYPVRTNNIKNGEFGRGFIGRDDQGNAVEAYLYRGANGKLYQLDQATLDSFQNDPILSQKLQGYIPSFSPTEMRSLAKESQPFTPDRISFESKIAGYQAEADVAQAEADRMANLGFFGKVKEGFTARFPKAAEQIPEAINDAARTTMVNTLPGGQAINAVSGFFANRTNRQNKPDQPTGQEGFLQKAAGFFKKAVGAE